MEGRDEQGEAALCPRQRLGKRSERRGEREEEKKICSRCRRRHGGEGAESKKKWKNKNNQRGDGEKWEWLRNVTAYAV